MDREQLERKQRELQWYSALWSTNIELNIMNSNMPPRRPCIQGRCRPTVKGSKSAHTSVLVGYTRPCSLHWSR